jgi:hypothetical protein
VTGAGGRRPRAAAAWGGCAAWALSACQPSTVAEAEAKHDVAWLERSASPDAVAALGRLSDHDPKALAALKIRAAYDTAAFHAAWLAVTRDAPWGAEMLRAGLADPKTADITADGMGKHDPHLTAFVGPLEGALVRLSASPQNANVAATIASIGAPAHDVVARRLDDASTRNAMCRGIASKYGDADARAALYAMPTAARDAPGCVEAVVRLGEQDDWSLAWLAEKSEPGMLGAGGKMDALSCARLHVAWVKALAARPASQYPALVVPLGYAVARCPAQTDGILADTIVHMPAARGLVVQAIDPFGRYDEALHATCQNLPLVADGTTDPPIVRERASDALAHLCVAPK